MKDFSQLKVGDVLSEVSHYKVTAVGREVTCTRLESGETVRLGNEYVKSYIESGDEIVREVEVTKEDKKDGTPGIRTIFEGIHAPQVFTVCFKKQDKPKTKKRFDEEVENRIDSFIKAVEKAKAQKKSISSVARGYFTDLALNPILTYEEGEDRVLRGYKVQFESRDGRYYCIDMDIDGENKVRPVNINTIKWLIYDGVKYIVK